MTGSRVGTVYLVGAGPGDPGLLTLRGGELLVLADAIVYDALANPALLAMASVGERERDVELHDVGKRGGASESARQDDINALLVQLAKDGKRVVRLKGGDPFVFGRGSEEAEALAAAGVPFEVVPGVTAGIAAPAYAGIPVTHRGLSTSVTFVTGHEDPLKEKNTVDWSALARAGGTIVLYMGVKSLPRIASTLMGAGMPGDTPAAAVRWGTYAHQQTVTATVSTLADEIQRAGLEAPVITVIGPVVSLRDTISWFDRRPLFGKRILVTRAQAQASTLSELLAVEGADVAEMPATKIESTDGSDVDAAVSRLTGYQWVVFTSQNAVRVFWDALRRHGLDSRALGSSKVAAVGPATAESLLDHGIAVDLSPERFVAEALLDALRERTDVRGSRVLYAAAEGARDVLPQGLSDLGASVDRVNLYRSIQDGAGADDVRARLLHGDVDLVTFTSASAVRAFVNSVGDDAAKRAKAASIGPVTSEAIRAAGLEIAVEADVATMSGLVDAICDHYAVLAG